MAQDGDERKIQLDGNAPDKMAGTTGLEPATSAVTGVKSVAGTRGINRLDLRLSATTGVAGCRWDILFYEMFHDSG